LDAVFTHYGSELLTVITITFLAVISPGPDFAVVTRNSLVYSRRCGIWTSFGIAIANWIHVFYTLAGLGFIISKSILLYSSIKYIGAAYLIYLGFSSLRNNTGIKVESGYGIKNRLSDFASFKTGFITNALNPKATVFYVSVFAQLVSPGTPIIIQILYGTIVSLICLIWFTLVAIFFNHQKVKNQSIKAQRPIEKIMGIILVGFGVKVAFSSLD